MYILPKENVSGLKKYPFIIFHKLHISTTGHLGCKYQVAIYIAREEMFQNCLRNLDAFTISHSSILVSQHGQES
jgi:hypothetical protein